MPSCQFKENFRLGTVSIKNTDTVKTQSISVSTMSSIVNKTTVYDNYQLAPGLTLEIKPIVSSIYTLYVKDDISNTSFNFTYVGATEEYFIKRSLKFLCNDCEECDCKDTLENCNENKCNPYYELLNQAIFLNHYFNVPGGYIKDTTSSIHHIDMMNDMCKSTLQVELLGNNCCFNDEMFKRLILSYYTGFYFTIKKYIIDEPTIINKQEELDKLDIKYQIQKVIGCITKYGQPLSTYENLYPF